MISAAVTIAGKDLRRRLRSRTAIIMGVVAPLGMAVLTGLALGDTGGFSATIGVVDADATALSGGLSEGLTTADAGPLTFVALDGEDEARRAVDDGRLDAALVVPRGFTDALASDDPADLVVLTDASKRISGEVAGSVAESLAARLDAGRLGVATALSVSPGPSDAEAASLAAAAAGVELPTSVRLEPLDEQYDAVAYFGASMGMLFLFFTVGVVARGLLIEAKEGTLARIRAAPVRDRAVLGGTALGMVALGLASMVAIWGVTSVAFGASWGAPAAVLAVIVGVVVAVAGIGSLVVGLARTEAQADGLTSLVAFLLALLGGSFLAPGSLPGALEVIAGFTPTGIALEAFTEVGAAGAGVIEVLPAVAVLVAVGIGCGAAGMVALERKVAS